MALLYRSVKLHDRFDSEVFTFLVPTDFLENAASTQQDIKSKDFLYGYQKWAVQLIRHEQHISAYLTLRNASDGLLVIVDFGFTMVNRDHFSRNESFSERACRFTVDRPSLGRQGFIGIPDLLNRGFVHDREYFMMDVELRNISSTFEQTVHLPREKDTQNQHLHFPKLETSYFTFGAFDWNLVLYPNGDQESEGRALVFLVRQTSLGHLCRVRYKLSLGQGDRMQTSDAIEQILDTSGAGDAYELAYSVQSLVQGKSKLHINIEMLSVRAISEVCLNPYSHGKNRCHYYDRDKQAWMMEADFNHLGCLRVRIFYGDVTNVPRKHLRYVSWGVTLLPSRGPGKPLVLTGSPYSSYYCQTDTDEGFQINSTITQKELQDGPTQYLDPDSRMVTMYVDWVETRLMYHAVFHRLDEIVCKQRQQQWREILALQAENYALEKQLHSYQLSISKVANKPGGSNGQIEPSNTSYPDALVPNTAHKSKTSDDLKLHPSTVTHGDTDTNIRNGHRNSFSSRAVEDLESIPRPAERRSQPPHPDRRHLTTHASSAPNLRTPANTTMSGSPVNHRSGNVSPSQSWHRNGLTQIPGHRNDASRYAKYNSEYPDDLPLENNMHRRRNLPNTSHTSLSSPSFFNEARRHSEIPRRSAGENQLVYARDSTSPTYGMHYKSSSGSTSPALTRRASAVLPRTTRAHDKSSHNTYNQFDYTH